MNREAVNSICLFGLTMAPIVIVLGMYIFYRHMEMRFRWEGAKMDFEVERLQLEIQKEQICLQSLQEENEKLDKIIANKLEYTR